MTESPQYTWLHVQLGVSCVTKSLVCCCCLLTPVPLNRALPHTHMHACTHVHTLLPSSPFAEKLGQCFHAHPPLPLTPPLRKTGKRQREGVRDSWRGVIHIKMASYYPFGLIICNKDAFYASLIYLFFCLSFPGRQIPVKVLFKRVSYCRKTQIRWKMKVGRQHFLQCFFLLSSVFIKAADSYLQDKMFKSIIVSVCIFIVCAESGWHCCFVLRGSPWGSSFELKSCLAASQQFGFPRMRRCSASPDAHTL